jgi:hypothetical protein
MTCCWRTRKRIGMPADTGLAVWQRDFASNLFSGDRQNDTGLAIYQRNIRHALNSALADTFPVVQQVLGEACFAELATAYSAAVPPVSPVLADYGDRLPEFLHPKHPLMVPLPYLAELVRFEQQVLACARAADATPLTAADWQALAPQTLLESRLVWLPSVQLFRSAFPVSSIWEVHQSPAPLPPGWQPPREDSCCLLYRRDHTVALHELTLPLAETLHRLLTGQSMADALAATAPDDETVTALIGLLQQGLIVALHPMEHS